VGAEFLLRVSGKPATSATPTCGGRRLEQSTPRSCLGCWTCSGIVFAMNRDQSFPARQWMRNVDARTSTPVPAAILALWWAWC
jgi:hypothetical protein